MNGADLLVAALENEGVEADLRRAGRGEPRRRRGAAPLDDRAGGDAPRAGGGVHGGDLRPADRRGPACASRRSGPGALNFTTGAAYALLGAMPMVMITGQKGILSRKQARFQIVDIVVDDDAADQDGAADRQPGDDPGDRSARRSGSRSRSGPGPVHLELPEDIAAEEAPDVPLVPPHPIDAPVAHPAALDRAAAMILAAERPLMMLGAAASRPRLADALSDVRRGACRSRSSTPRWARARSPAARTSTWAPRRSRSATTCTRRSTAPT